MIRGRCTACSSQIWQTVLSPTASLRRSRSRPQSNACCLFPHAQIHDVAEELSYEFVYGLSALTVAARSYCENCSCFPFPPYRSSLHLLFLSASTHGVGSNELFVIVIVFASTSNGEEQSTDSKRKKYALRPFPRRDRIPSLAVESQACLPTSPNCIPPFSNPTTTPLTLRLRLFYSLL